MIHADHTLLCFDDFELDLIRGCLSRGGKQIDLRPKTFKVLTVLVENAGRLVAKDEIMQAVWSDVVVTEDSLVRCIHELRAAMGDGNQKIIRTVPRRGYLFDVPVSLLDQSRYLNPDAAIPNAEMPAEKMQAYVFGTKPVRDQKRATIGTLSFVLLISIGKRSRPKTRSYNQMTNGIFLVLGAFAL